MGDGVLQRTMRILGAFSEDDPELTAVELAERSGLALSTVHRLIGSLVEEGLLSRAPAHRFAVGSRLWEVGELSPLSLRLREGALPHMVRLYEATGENVHLAVLDGPSPRRSSALYVGRVTGRASIPTLSRMGGRGPLHTTGVGKALLATRDEAWLADYFAVPREHETMHSRVTEDEIRDDIARARSRGYATTRQEMTLGNFSLAVGLAPVAGLPPVAVGVVVHLARGDERRLAPLVLQAAADLHETLRAH
jgi:DNA-binding IclR family transcriptional regulator